MMHRYGLYICWVWACLMTLGSLYFSDVRHIEPCYLCWYQRIAIYPLVILLGIATWRQFFTIIPFVLPQVILGFLLSVYQVLVQEVPSFRGIDLCGVGPSCTTKIDIGLGVISIPMLALFSFLALSILLFWTWNSREAKTKEN